PLRRSRARRAAQLSSSNSRPPASNPARRRPTSAGLHGGETGTRCPLPRRKKGSQGNPGLQGSLIRSLLALHPLDGISKSVRKLLAEDSRMRRITLATLCVLSLLALTRSASNDPQPGRNASSAPATVYVSDYDPTISI